MTVASVEGRAAAPAVLSGDLASLCDGEARLGFEREVLPSLVAGQRWFAGKGQEVDKASIVDDALLTDDDGDEYLLVHFAVALGGGDPQHYLLPIAVTETPPARPIARIGSAHAVDASDAPAFPLAVVRALRAGTTLRTRAGDTIRFMPTARLPAGPDPAPAEVRRLSGEQSNTSIALGRAMVLKVYRRLQSGEHPEVEVGRFLTEVAGFSGTPATYGAVEHVGPDGEPTALLVLQEFVPNEGDAWSATLKALRAGLDALPGTETPDVAPDHEAVFAASLALADTLGRRTGEMHVALATPTDDPAFAAEPMTGADVAVATADARAQAGRAFAALSRLRGQAEAVDALLARQDECLAAIDALAAEPLGAVKTRIHGDYHLGQVLAVPNDVMIVDFEGEPARPVAERRAKASPLRDVGGMLRSFAYAADTVSREGGGRHAAVAAEWSRLVEHRFLAAYAEATRGRSVWVEDEGSRERLLRLHLLGKALYEINYEADNRPDWIETPVRGVLSILDQETAP